MKTFLALCALALLGVVLASPTDRNGQQMLRDPQNGQWISKQQYMQMYPYGMMDDNQMYDSSSYNGYNSNMNSNRQYNPYPSSNMNYNSNMYMTTTPRG